MGTHTQMLEARADSIQKYTKVYECVRMHTKVYECIRIKRKLQLLDLMQLYFERLWAPTAAGQDFMGMLSLCEAAVATCRPLALWL